MQSNNPDPNSIFQNVKSISLTENEKSGVKDNLLEFIKKNPAKVEESGIREEKINPLKALFNIFLKPMPAFFALLILATGGTSFAAQYSVPGDILYPIKINVNEEIRSAFAFSEKSRAYVALDRAEERLEEAEILAIDGRLTPEVRTDLEIRFKLHMDEAQETLVALSETDNNTKVAYTSRINSDIKAKLNVHEEILTKISDTQIESTKKEVNSLNTQVKVQLRNSTKFETAVNQKISTQTTSELEISAKLELETAEKKIKEAEKIILDQKLKLGAAATIDAEKKLKAAKDLVIAGKEKLEAKVFADALDLLKKSDQVANEARLLVKTELELGITDNPGSAIVDLNIQGEKESEEVLDLDTSVTNKVEATITAPTDNIKDVIITPIINEPVNPILPKLGL